MEIVLTLHAAGCFLAPCHLPRELNEWAAELTHSGYQGFSDEFYLDVKVFFGTVFVAAQTEFWTQLGFHTLPTYNPVTGFGG